MGFIVTFVVGFLFALGLGVSGMTQPQKVIGFLDLFGSWDPSLAFVMIGAIAVHALSYPLILKKGKPLLDEKFFLPTKKEITPRLAVGAALFGVGWGLGGYCPGPAIVSLAAGGPSVLTFLGFMVLGMLVFKWMDRRKA